MMNVAAAATTVGARAGGNGSDSTDDDEEDEDNDEDLHWKQMMKIERVQMFRSHRWNAGVMKMM